MLTGAGIGMMNGGGRPDHQVYADALCLVDEVERLGFDSLWTVEHHFTGHSPVPNALQLLAYLAGRTSTLMLGAAVVVLPWHHPLRVAEEIAALDVLSGGRVIAGFGRGASPIEFAGFQIPIAEARDRFVEAVQVIRLGLSQDRFCYDGKFFQIPETSIRPRPISHPERRMVGAAVSPESGELMAELDLGLLLSPEPDRTIAREQVRRHRTAAERLGYTPADPVCHYYVLVDDDRERARSRAERHIRRMIDMLDRHYRISAHSLAGVKGYEHYAEAARDQNGDEIKERMLQTFMAKHLIGTPDDCAARLLALADELGIGHFVGEFTYGDMPVEECRANMRLFAAEVMPRIR